MKISRLAVAVICVGVVALLAGDAFAQGGRGRGGGGGMRMGGGGGGLAGLMAENEKVQDELKLEDEQIEKIKTFAEDQRADMMDAFQEARDSGDMSGIMETMAELREDAAKAEAKTMADVLNEDQLKRYKQLAIQQKGTGSLTDADVVKALGLSDDDQKTIKEAIADNQEKTREMFQSGDRENMRENMTEMGKELEETLMGVLSDDQKKKFEEMKGEAFEFPRQGGQRRQRQDF